MPAISSTAGSVRLCIVDDTGSEVALDVLQPGDEFGELSLLDGGDRSMTAITMEPTTVLVLKRDDFIELLRSRPDAALDVVQVLARRIRRVDDLLRRRVSRDPNAAIAERDSFGHRVADGVARFGGSWHFIGLFFLFLIAWISSNIFLIFYNRAGSPVDPYPFILLNLFLSMLAAIQAPVILMSQNRQDAKDRIRSELDYQVNLKAELEIADLHHKVDVLTSHMLDTPPRTDTVPIRGNAP